MSNLTLPESSTEPKDIYEVVFEDWNGTVLKTVNVEEGMQHFTYKPNKNRLYIYRLG